MEVQTMEINLASQQSLEAEMTIETVFEYERALFPSNYILFQEKKGIGLLSGDFQFTNTYTKKLASVNNESKNRKRGWDSFPLSKSEATFLS